MKPILLLLTLSSALLVSCSSTRHVTVATSSDDINERALESPARVYVRDSSSGRVLGPYDAVDLRIGIDSTTWVDQQSLQLRAAATRRLVRVEFSQGSGALQGLAIGFVSGTLTGAAAGFMAGDDKPLYRPKDGFEAIVMLPALFVPRFTAGEKAMIYGSVTGLVGGLGGLFVGAAVERYDRYELQDVTRSGGGPPTSAGPRAPSSVR